MSYETRELKILTLNDTFWTGIAVYCVVTLTIVSAPLSFILANDPRVAYAVVASLAWVAVTLTNLIVFVPKVLELYFYVFFVVVAQNGNPLGRTLSYKL